jgi:outer membrane protein
MPARRFCPDLKWKKISPFEGCLGRQQMRAAVSLRVIAALLISVSSAVQVQAASLTDAMIGAYRNSGLLEQNRALLRAADEDVAQAVATLRPVVSYAARVSANDPAPFGGDRVGGSLSLNADMLLYDFGRSELAVDAAKETVLATREALVGIEQQVLLRAAAAYLGVRREAAFVELRRNNVRLISEQLRAAQDRFDVGEVTRTDVSIAEARLAAAQAGLAAAEGSLAQAAAEYQAAVGQAPRNLQPPPAAPQTAASLAAAKGVASRQHPDLKRAQREVKVAELGLAIARGARQPSVNGSAQISVDEDGNDSTSLGVTLAGPIYQGGAISSRERQAAARRDAARAGLHITRLGVEQNVANAWSLLKVAEASVQASDQQVRASRLALRGVREEFSVGQRTTLDVLDREQELLDAETNLIAAQIDQKLASYQLLATMGLLTVDHLRLGIPTYDPAAYYNAVQNAPRKLSSPQGDRLDRVLRSIGQN